MYPSPLIEHAVTQISTLPGIGKKTALRLVLHLLRKEKNSVNSLTNSINQLVEQIQYCNSCHAVSETPICSICSNAKRIENKQICVVEEICDLLAIESTGQYHGLYHILGGVISPIRGIQPEQLHIESLIQKVSSSQPLIKELIFALNATVEGDTTVLYICRKLKTPELSFSTLARGIPLGSELEYTDSLTLGRSITDRHTYALSS